MGPIFPKSTDAWLLKIAATLPILGLIAGGFIHYYMSPEYYEVGYRPKQPIAYSHALHAGELAIDCRYCHSSVEKGPVAGIPSTETCMNCHTLIHSESPKLAALRESWNSSKPLKWVRVHDLPEYANFNHSVHVRANIGCASCHGNVADMEVVQKVEPMSMYWCLECHRNPSKYIRPQNQITNTRWVATEEDKKFAVDFVKTNNITPPEDCTACHY